MLKTVHVKNLALVRHADITFGEGMNVLTGETGAGKSILMESIVMGLGGRVQRHMLREDTPALIELIFETDERERARLTDAGLTPEEDGQLIISRKITDGKSLLRIGGETYPASFLKERAPLLIDIYGQNDHMVLRRKDKQLELIDSFRPDLTAPRKEVYKKAYSDAAASGQALEDLTMDSSARSRRLDLLSYEIGEIRAAGLKAGEDDILEAQYKKIRGAEKLMQTMQQIRALTGYDENGAAENAGLAARLLTQILPLDGDLEPLHSLLADIDALLGEFDRSAADYSDTLEFDEETFDEIQRRLDEINRLKTKYGRTISLILDALAEREEEYAALSDYEENFRKAKHRAAEDERRLREAGTALSEARTLAAASFSEALVQQLKDLNFAAVRFHILVENTGECMAEGMDRVHFLISTNVGEEEMPLEKVASGGELSRIMLGIKSMFAESGDAMTLIFDEIDTGISGRTAQKVAEKLRAVSRSRQVICVTHLPQIAAMADHHLLITKEVSEGMSATKIETIHGADITDEVARMISGAEVTEQTKAAAEEMIRFGRSM